MWNMRCWVELICKKKHKHGFYMENNNSIILCMIEIKEEKNTSRCYSKEPWLIDRSLRSPLWMTYAIIAHIITQIHNNNNNNSISQGGFTEVLCNDNSIAFKNTKRHTNTNIEHYLYCDRFVGLDSCILFKCDHGSCEVNDCLFVRFFATLRSNALLIQKEYRIVYKLLWTKDRSFFFFAFETDWMMSVCIIFFFIHLLGIVFLL